MSCTWFNTSEKNHITKSRRHPAGREIGLSATSSGYNGHPVRHSCSPRACQNPAKNSPAARRSAPQRGEKVQVCRPVLHLSRPFSRACVRAYTRARSGDTILNQVYRVLVLGYVYRISGHSVRIEGTKWPNRGDKMAELGGQNGRIGADIMTELFCLKPLPDIIGQVVAIAILKA